MKIFCYFCTLDLFTPCSEVECVREKNEGQRGAQKPQRLCVCVCVSFIILSIHLPLIPASLCNTHAHTHAHTHTNTHTPLLCACMHSSTINPNASEADNEVHLREESETSKGVLLTHTPPCARVCVCLTEDLGGLKSPVMKRMQKSIAPSLLAMHIPPPPKIICFVADAVAHGWKAHCVCVWGGGGGVSLSLHPLPNVKWWLFKQSFGNMHRCVFVCVVCVCVCVAHLPHQNCAWPE